MGAALPSTTPRPPHKSSTDGLGPSTLPSGWRGELPSALGQAAKFPRSGRSPKTIAARAIKKQSGGRWYVQLRSSWTIRQTIVVNAIIVYSILYSILYYTVVNHKQISRNLLLVMAKGYPLEDEDSTCLRFACDFTVYSILYTVCSTLQ
jgi:hypothetical protein